jgi:Mannosyltransferase putative
VGLLTYSGAVIIDKTRNLPGLLMACHLNSLQVRDEITYQKFYGDKESYWFAHALTSTPYHFVPGYSGGIGRITHVIEDDMEIMDKEQICTLQLLHVLESTGEPLWFNNAITEFKGANDAAYIVPEGWIGHDGNWYGDDDNQRFPNELCVDIPDENKLVGGGPERVHRVDGDLKRRLDNMIQLVEKYDNIMEDEELVCIVRSDSEEC